ncbi:MAG: hypothetical protein NDJ90_14450 [Oligoflexia bacterium]|nr:hypothetical protein [Oligoflexia bacterium]
MTTIPRPFSLFCAWLFCLLLQGCSFAFLREAATVSPLLSTISVVPRYRNAPDWNQYVDRAAPEAACPADLGSGYFSCLHGGEKKRVDFSGAASCAGYVISDELGAFDWACDDRGGSGRVYFFSRSLKEDKGLADLVKETSWKPNRVVIRRNGIIVAESPLAAWWSNPVIPLPANAVAGTFVTLASPGTIYTVATPTTVSGGFELAPGGAGDRIGIVTLPGAALTLTGSTPACGNLIDDADCLIELRDSKFFWIEGELRGPGLGTGVSGNLAHHGAIRGVGVTGFQAGIGNSGYISSSFLFRIRASRNVTGVNLVASRNRLKNVFASNNYKGISIKFGNNFVQDAVAALNRDGSLYMSQGSGSAVTALTAMEGIHLTSGSGNTFHNFFQAGTLTLIETNEATISQGTMDDVNSVNSSSKFTANWLTTSPSCFVDGGTNPGLDSSCANQGASDAVLTVEYGKFAPYTFPMTDDSANASDTGGAVAFESIADWLHFENRWRAWGQGVSGVPCQAGSSCRIWDFRLPPDTRMSNTTGDAASLNPDFGDGEPCPPLLDGSVVSVDLSTPPRTFLRNAIELIGWDDGMGGGNHNGLCESGETCLYTPNFGAYQGQGDFTKKRCIFKDGIVSGVTIYAYPEP